MQKKSGFTLIELSIVLVIIGLIVGGVLVGQELVKAAQMRAVISDIEEIKRSAMTFRLKYNCLPGDCPNATQFFGVDPDGAAPPYRTTSPVGTINGDGNKSIHGNYAAEAHRFWQQLKNAELFTGLNTGTCGVVGSDCRNGNDGWKSTAGINVPKSRWNQGGYVIHNVNEFDTYWGLPTLYPGQTYGNIIIFGAADGTDWFARTPAINPLYAYSIDSKVDDGLPKSGSTQASGGSFTVADGPCISGSAYGTSNDVSCWMIFKSGF